MILLIVALVALVMLLHGGAIDPEILFDDSMEWDTNTAYPDNRESFAEAFSDLKAGLSVRHNFLEAVKKK